MARRRKPPMPPRDRLPRVLKRSQEARRQCEYCGRLDRAVSTRGTITYYGPACCEQCGAERGLRKAERPIDWPTVLALYAVPSELRRAVG